MSEFLCPSCGHDQVQRLSLAVMNTDGDFAKAHAAPTKKGTALATFCLMFSLVIALVFQSSFFIFVALIAFAFLIQAVFYNSREWPDLFDEWQKKWICMRCGKIFEIDKTL